MIEVVVSKEELIDFINSQPDDKKIKWGELNITNPCGCLFVQYVKQVFPNATKIDTGIFSCFISLTQEQKIDVRVLFPINYDSYGKPDTFGGLKQAVSQAK